MKIKAIANLCKTSGLFMIGTDEDGAQWLGDGHGIYKVANLPPLTDELICAMFDITEKQREGISYDNIGEVENIDLSDDSTEDKPAHSLSVSLNVGSVTYIPFSDDAAAEAVFINQRQLSPFSDKLEYSYYIRNGFLVVKVGMLICAEINPLKPKGENFEYDFPIIAKQFLQI